MSKILITTIGTNGKNNNSSLLKLNFKDESFISPYIYNDIQKFYDIDKVILVGTIKSDWRSLYYFACKYKNISPNKKYAEKLRDPLKNKNKSNGKLNTDFEEMNEVIAPLKAFFCDIILLKHGLNATKLDKSIEEIKKISEKINDGDEIYIDISHSFHTLLMLEIITAKYLNEFLGKNVTVKAVTYGMLTENISLDGKTSIVNLSRLLTMIEYTRAIDEYLHFGTTHALCETLDQSGDLMGITKANVSALYLLNDSITNKDFDEFKKLIISCHNIVDGKLPCTAAAESIMLIKTVYADIDKRFYHAIEDETLLRMKYAKWHFDKKRINISAIIMQETVLSFFVGVCEIDAYNYEKHSIRNKLKNKLETLQIDNTVCARFRDSFKELRDLRNRLAHPISDIQSEDIAALEQHITELTNLYVKHFKTKRTANYIALKDTFMKNCSKL